MNRTRKLGWAAAAVVLLLGAATLYLSPDPQPTLVTPAAQPLTTANARGEPAPAATEKLAHSVPKRVDCGRSTVVIKTVDGPEFRECVQPAGTLQNGSLRTFRFEGVDEKGWTLRIDAAGSAVQLVEAGGGHQPQRLCKDEGCNGIILGRADINGIQSISLTATRLHGGSGGKSNEDAIATIDADLSSNATALTCAGEGVTMNYSDSSYTQFCSLGGTGFETRDDGTRAYVFSSLEGETLSVTPENGAIMHMELTGTGLQCDGGGCGGAIWSPGGNGEFTLQLLGASLQKIGPGGSVERSVTLNGWLKVPPLE